MMFVTGRKYGRFEGHMERELTTTQSGDFAGVKKLPKLMRFGLFTPPSTYSALHEGLPA